MLLVFYDGIAFIMMLIFMPLNLFTIVAYCAYRRREQKHTLRYPHAYIAVLSLLIGTIAWSLDAAGVACDPRSAMQIHAAWHILTCGSIVLMYTYFRTERRNTATPVPTERTSLLRDKFDVAGMMAVVVFPFCIQLWLVW